VSGYDGEPFTETHRATTGADGRFPFTAQKARFSDPAFVSVTAPNFGVGFVDIRGREKWTDLTLKLVADDVQITGQIVDLERRPVVGATLRVLEIKASPDEDLGPFRGKLHSFTIGKVKPGEAENKARQVDYLLMRLKQKLVQLPAGIAIVSSTARWRHL